MLNFKIGQFYKDTNGDDWEYQGCILRTKDGLNYYFRYKNSNCSNVFYEQEDNSVTFCEDGSNLKIPFVEEKEREWVVGEEYECFDAVTQRVIKARLTKIIEKTDSHLVFVFHVNGLHFNFHFEGIVLVAGRYVVFKDGAPQELKDRLNKRKLTNERKCIKKGRTYKNHNGASYKFKKRIKTQRGLLAVFEKEDGSIYFDILYKMNNIECIPFSYSSAGMFLCADESIREKSSNKAVRIMQ